MEKKKKSETAKLRIPTSPSYLASLDRGAQRGRGVGRKGSGDKDKGKGPYHNEDRHPSDNKYFQKVESLQPNDMLQKFAKSAPLNVQEAAKGTIAGIFGSLPDYALDASLVTTNARLANLLFQMQVSGYILKNAEYRMTLTRSLKGLPRLPTPPARARTRIKIGKGKGEGEGKEGKVRMDSSDTGGIGDTGGCETLLSLCSNSSSSGYTSNNTDSADALFSNILFSDIGNANSGLKATGNVTVTVTASDASDGDVTTISLSAEELTSALSEEITSLKQELLRIRSEREVELQTNLLTYIQALTDSDMARLSTDMGDEVMSAIQLLVDVLMKKLGVMNSGSKLSLGEGEGEGEEDGYDEDEYMGVGYDEEDGGEVLLQQSVGVIAQLCMWQIVVGYNLCELEANDKGVDFGN